MTNRSATARPAAETISCLRPSLRLDGHGYSPDLRRRQLTPHVAAPPPVAVGEVDGGRLRTRQAGIGPGVQQPQAKEDKIACLLSLRSVTHAEDPQAEPLPAFRDAPRVGRLVRLLKAQSLGGVVGGSV
jgi:hypothetical protein